MRIIQTIQTDENTIRIDDIHDVQPGDIAVFEHGIAPIAKVEDDEHDATGVRLYVGVSLFDDGDDGALYYDSPYRAGDGMWPMDGGRFRYAYHDKSLPVRRNLLPDEDGFYRDEHDALWQVEGRKARTIGKDGRVGPYRDGRDISSSHFTRVRLVKYMIAERIGCSGIYCFRTDEGVDRWCFAHKTGEDEYTLTFAASHICELITRSNGIWASGKRPNTIALYRVRVEAER